CISLAHQGEQSAQQAGVLCELDQPVGEADVITMIGRVTRSEAAFIFAIRVDGAVPVAAGLELGDPFDDPLLVFYGLRNRRNGRLRIQRLKRQRVVVIVIVILRSVRRRGALRRIHSVIVFPVLLIKLVGPISVFSLEAFVHLVIRKTGGIV